MWALSLYCIPSVSGLPSSFGSASLTFVVLPNLSSICVTVTLGSKSRSTQSALTGSKVCHYFLQNAGSSAPSISYRKMICEMSNPTLKRGKCKLIVCLLLGFCIYLDLNFTYIYVCLCIAVCVCVRMHIHVSINYMIFLTLWFYICIYRHNIFWWF